VGGVAEVAPIISKDNIKFSSKMVGVCVCMLLSFVLGTIQWKSRYVSGSASVHLAT
jgi:hypothetical protein